MDLGAWKIPHVAAPEFLNQIPVGVGLPVVDGFGGLHPIYDQKG